MLPPDHAAALETLLSRMPSVEWALTGSVSFALRGVPVDPDDIDVQTHAGGVRVIETTFKDAVVDPVEHVESDPVRSQLARLELGGVSVELIGDLQTRRADGTWEPPVDVTEYREWQAWRGHDVPVLSLDYEADASERLGRTERAELLREHID